MRAIALGLAVLGLSGFGLAACDSGSVPSPAERQNGALSEIADIDTSLVTLQDEGLTVGAEAFYFAAGQTEVEAAMARVLGKASDMTENEECGAGQMASSTFPGGLTVNFQGGSLVGWFLRDGAENVQVEGAVGIGVSQSEIEAADGFVMIEDSTLGEEFALGDSIGGFFEDGNVAMLYAGTQCFFR